MNTTLVALFATLVVFAAGVGSGWVYGARSGEKKLEQARAELVKRHDEEKARAVAEGEAALARLREDQRLLALNHAKQLERLRHVPILARTDRLPVCQLPGMGSGGSGTGPAAPPGPAAAAGASPGAPGAGAEPAAPGDGAAQPAAGGAGLRLTLGAVWVWNSALAGADVPAAACGADGTPGPACAAASGASVIDAWANHAENAARCRANAARHARLIEYLRATRPAPSP